MTSPYRRCQLGQGRRGCACRSILSGENLLHHWLLSRGDFNRHGWRSDLCGPCALRGDQRSATAREKVPTADGQEHQGLEQQGEQ